MSFKNQILASLILGVFVHCAPKKDSNTDSLTLLALAGQATGNVSGLSQYVGQGRLLYTEGNTIVRVFDLDTRRFAHTFNYQDRGNALRVYSGGSYLFGAVALGAGSDSEIRYIDLGIQSQNKVQPREIGSPIRGNQFGGHYRTDGTHHLSFFDSDGKTSLVFEDTLRSGQTTEIIHTQSPHHGVAIGLDGSHILISRKHSDSAIATPFGASVYQRSGNNLTKISDTENCNNLHGEANNSGYVAFGCRQLSGTRDTGVLVVRKSDRASYKVNYPTDTATDFVSNLWAHNNQTRMIGNYGNKPSVLLFDPATANSAQEIALGAEYGSGSNTRPTPVYEWAQGNEIAFLLTNGNVAVHRADNLNHIRTITTGLTSHTGVRMASGMGRVFLSVASPGRIIEVPLDGENPVATYNVGGSPSNLVYQNTIASAQTLGRAARVSPANIGWVDTYDPWSDLNE